MVRPVRNKKPVNYSLASDSDSDARNPEQDPRSPSKTAPKAKLKPLQKASTHCKRKRLSKGERVPLDDKIFRRGLETALALSARELARAGGPGVPHPAVSASADTHDVTRTAEEGAGSAPRVRGERKAAAPRTEALEDGSDGDGTDPSDGLSGEGEEDSDFSDSRDTDEDEEPAATKSKARAAKRKEGRAKPPPPDKRGQQPEPRGCSAPGKPGPLAEETPALCSLPAPSGSGGGRRPPGGSARSPTQNLRLGLSRLARVKPLHPSAAGSHPG
ncbi:RAD51-associated protein 1 [Perognathus longimembris pacificus]|uniref:RAD51-associated protein 1 n=1 Tax=Perognathus longimembris pacificus TaxID=214514 RepID=UPI002018C9A8|nr:RAD51-associated protein 1 [Perognathus longimembris pacificus]